MLIVDGPSFCVLDTAVLHVDRRPAEVRWTTNCLVMRFDDDAEAEPPGMPMHDYMLPVHLEVLVCRRRANVQLAGVQPRLQLLQCVDQAHCSLGALGSNWCAPCLRLSLQNSSVWLNDQAETGHLALDLLANSHVRNARSRRLSVSALDRDCSITMAATMTAPPCLRTCLV